MDDLRVFFDSLHNLSEAYGDEVVEIVDFGYILKQERILKWLQARIEHNIAYNFLPGFRFKSLTHFAWHLRNEEYFRSWVLGHRMPPRKFTDMWIRRLLMPTRYHYLSEVALSLQQRSLNHRNFHKHFPDVSLPYRSGWIEIMRAWIEIEDTIRGYTKNGADGIPWSQKYSKVHDETIYKWARKADEYRRLRQTGNPPNYWQISNINYRGNQLENVEAVFENVGLVNTEYSEHWKWMGEDPEQTPHRTSLTFVLPASLDLWDAPDHKG